MQKLPVPTGYRRPKNPKSIMIKVTCKIVHLRSCIRCEFNQNTTLDIETTLEKANTFKCPSAVCEIRRNNSRDIFFNLS